MVTQAWQYSSDKSRQQWKLDPRPSYCKSGSVHRLLYIHGCDAWAHQDQITTDRGGPAARLFSQDGQIQHGPVDKSISRRLEEIRDSLEPLVGERPSPPLLGYRGCVLRDTKTNREWVAYGGVVSLKEAGTSTSRSDKRHAFEKLLLRQPLREYFLPRLCKMDGSILRS